MTPVWSQHYQYHHIKGDFSRSYFLQVLQQCYHWLDPVFTCVFHSKARIEAVTFEFDKLSSLRRNIFVNMLRGIALYNKGKVSAR